MSRDSGSGGSGDLVELLGVEGDSERGLDSGSKSLGVTENEDTGVVDLTATDCRISKAIRQEEGCTDALTKAVF